MRTTKVLLAAYIALSLLCAVSCKRGNQHPIIVNVLRNEKSRSFEITEPKLLQFESQRPKTSSGRPIIVQSILMNQSQFENALADQHGLSEMKPDLVVLDSPNQAKASPGIQAQSVRARNICGRIANCPAFIPSWVSGDRLDAAQLVLKALSSSS
jgi:hypothetical protein